MIKKVQQPACIFGANFLLTQVRALEDEIQGAKTSDDIEHIHRLRVASRRLRNGFELFKDCLPKKKADQWQDQIRKVTKALGSARDLDIQIDLLNQETHQSLDADSIPGYNRLLLRLKQRRTKAQSKVNNTLQELVESNVLHSMDKRLEMMTADAENIYLYAPSLYQKAFNAISTRLDDFLGYEKYIREPDNTLKLHAMRISGKHLRYTLEIFAPMYDQTLTAHLRAMKDMQDVLGELHDNDVWISWLPIFIDQERKRIEDYYGHIAPLDELVPGFQHLIADRQQVREENYQSFLKLWDTLKQEAAWKGLRAIIQAPMKVEDALVHFAAKEDEMTVNAADEEDNEDQEMTDEVRLEGDDIQPDGPPETSQPGDS